MLLELVVDGGGGDVSPQMWKWIAAAGTFLAAAFVAVAVGDC